ncbi:MAG: glycoside hydrolase family 16 protein [Terracidiphilus sp.]|jgi:beta-glucanase (GH16 family)
MQLKSLLLPAVASAFIAAVSQAPSPAPVSEAPPQAAGYSLVFEDNFHPLDLSADGRGDHNWYNGVWFRHQLPPNSNVETTHGYLSIHWKREQGTPETSITTLSRDLRHFRAWRYGYFEAQMKWRPVRGSWPAFWLIPVQDAQRTNMYGSTRESGEIDIFEGQGERTHDYYATIHDWINSKDAHNNGGNNRLTLPSQTDYAQWHTYGLLWTPGKMTWYFDNVPIHSESTYGVFDMQDYYLALTEQVGPNWKYGSTVGVDENDMSLDVRWVRVWQQR